MPSSTKRSEHRPTPLAAAWEQSYATYLSGRAVLDGVDELATELEAKWGVDRLRLLVSVESREKFDRQRFKLNSAIVYGNLQDVIEQANRMMLGWRVLDTEATANGSKKLAKEVMEVALEDGTVVAIVPSPAHVAMIPPGRKTAVFTLDEVARLLVASEAVIKAKWLWQGAEVVRVRRPRDPIKDIPHRAERLDDDLDDMLHGTPLGRKQEG